MQKDLFLAPASKSGDAYEHLNKAVIKGIPVSDLEKNIDENANKPVRIWGLNSSLKRTWKSAEQGDWLLFYTGGEKYQYAAQISSKSHNPELGEYIRSEFLDISNSEIKNGKKWDLLLYLNPPVNVDLSGNSLSDWLGYERAYKSRFLRVPEKRLTTIEDKFGDLETLIERFSE